MPRLTERRLALLITLASPRGSGSCLFALATVYLYRGLLILVYLCESILLLHVFAPHPQRSIRVHAAHDAPVPLPALHRLCEAALGRAMDGAALEVLLGAVLHLDAAAVVAAGEVGGGETRARAKK